MPEKTQRDKAIAGLVGKKASGEPSKGSDPSKGSEPSKGRDASSGSSGSGKAADRSSRVGSDSPRGSPQPSSQDARAQDAPENPRPADPPRDAPPAQARAGRDEALAQAMRGSRRPKAAHPLASRPPSEDAWSVVDDMPASAKQVAAGQEPPRADQETAVQRPARLKETTSLPDGHRLRERGQREDAIQRRARPEQDAAASPPDAQPAGTLEQDEGFLERARRREDKARRSQAKDEARRMRQDAKRMLAEARQQEKRRTVLEAHMEKVAVIGEDMGYDPGRPITRIPDLPIHMEQVSFRTIEPDRAYIRLAFDTQSNSYLYELIEPQLTANEQKIMAFLRDTLIRTLDGRRAQSVDWAAYLREAVQRSIVDHDILVDHVSTERILYYLVRDFLGFGPIDALMRDDKLEDISCDGPGIPIYVFHRQHESIRSNVVFEEELEIDSFVIRLAQRSGKHISIADPLLDATLPDGSRLQATLSREVTSRGSSFTIRKFREEPFTPPDLIDYGTMTTPMCAYFWFMMEEGRSLLFAGGTASGKTTTLNATCQFIPPEKKIVSIEDTREINLLHENWIAGVTRSGFGGESLMGKRAGSIDMYRLLEAALRQRPEFLLVGEVRGPEALTLFQAMATGHAVYSTMHADSTKSAVYRLENPPINVPRMMLQTLDTVAIQAQVKVGGKMARRVKEVVEIIGFDPDTEDLLTNTVFYWDAATDRHVFTGHSGVFDQIQEKKGWSDERFQQEWERRMHVLEWMRGQGINHFKDFSKIIHEYYQRPEKVMDRIRADGFEMDSAVARGNRAGDTMAMYDTGAAADGADGTEVGEAGALDDQAGGWDGRVSGLDGTAATDPADADQSAQGAHRPSSDASGQASDAAWQGDAEHGASEDEA